MDSDSFGRKLNGALSASPDGRRSSEGVALLRKALTDRSNRTVKRAAELIADAEEQVFVDDLPKAWPIDGCLSIRRRAILAVSARRRSCGRWCDSNTKTPSCTATQSATSNSSQSGADRRMPLRNYAASPPRGSSIARRASRFSTAARCCWRTLRSKHDAGPHTRSRSWAN